MAGVVIAQLPTAKVNAKVTKTPASPSTHGILARVSAHVAVAAIVAAYLSMLILQEPTS